MWVSIAMSAGLHALIVLMAVADCGGAHKTPAPHKPMSVSLLHPSLDLIAPTDLRVYDDRSHEDPDSPERDAAWTAIDESTLTSRSDVHAVDEVHRAHEALLEQLDGVLHDVTDRRIALTLDAASEQDKVPAPAPQAPDPVVPDQTPPEDLPPPEPEDLDWLRYVDAGPARSSAPPDDLARAIAAVDSEAQESTRSVVVASNAGPFATEQAGQPAHIGNPDPIRMDGLEDGDLGDQPSNTPSQQVAQPVRGGGQAPNHPPETGAAGGHRHATAGTLGATTTSTNVSDPRLSKTNLAVPPSLDATEPDPSWWQPRVARYVAPRAESNNDSPRAESNNDSPRAESNNDSPGAESNNDSPRAESNNDSPRAEPREEPRQDRVLPAPTKDAEVSDAPKDTPHDGPEDGEVEHEDAPAIVQLIESFADLQAEMGWGGASSSTTAPRRTLPGQIADSGSAPTSPQVSDPDLRLDHVVFVNAIETPLGRYRAQIDHHVRERWLADDLSLHDRALGIQGDTVVVFRVRSNGKVDQKTLVRSSGYASLDRMAIEAIPSKLPKIPKDVDLKHVYHRYGFHYRNPLITAPTPRP